MGFGSLIQHFKSRQSLFREGAAARHEKETSQGHEQRRQEYSRMDDDTLVVALYHTDDELRRYLDAWRGRILHNEEIVESDDPKENDEYIQSTLGAVRAIINRLTASGRGNDMTAQFLFTAVRTHLAHGD